MPWRVQNLVWMDEVSARPIATPTSQRSARLPSSTIAMKTIESRSLRPFSALTPTQSIPKKVTHGSLSDGISRHPVAPRSERRLRRLIDLRVRRWEGDRARGGADRDP